LCVFGLLGAILIPSVAMGDAAEAWRTGSYFAKVIIYYLLFVSLVTTPARLRSLLTCILVFCGCVTLLAVLRYHDIIYLEALDALNDTQAGAYGSEVTIRRLQGTGIFHDPNELCVLLAAMVPLALYFVVTSRNVALRVACGAFLPLFGYAIMLTGSRGGFIAFAGGLAALSWMRFGWKKTALFGAVGLPALLVVFAGRQTELSTGAGTAQTRVELWRDWLQTFKENPLTGAGMTLRKEDDESLRRPDLERKMIAHNSYLQAFADLGVVGGCLFTGAFFVAGWSLYRLNTKDSLIIDPELNAVQPYLLACLTAYCLGMMSLSISYMIPTYLMLALVVAYTRLAQKTALVTPAPLRFDPPLLLRIVAAGIFILFSIYVFVRFLA